jgi:hypothetical protein
MSISVILMFYFLLNVYIENKFSTEDVTHSQNVSPFPTTIFSFGEARLLGKMLIVVSSYSAMYFFYS